LLLLALAIAVHSLASSKDLVTSHILFSILLLNSCLIKDGCSFCGSIVLLDTEEILASIEAN
jgi:ABC-type cobalamin transport system permease subunit